MKELGSGTTYNTHNTTSLIRTLKYVPDIFQTEEAFTVEEYTHTHTHVSTRRKKSLSSVLARKSISTTLNEGFVHYGKTASSGKKKIENGFH